MSHSLPFRLTALARYEYCVPHARLLNWLFPVACYVGYRLRVSDCHSSEYPVSLLRGSLFVNSQTRLQVFVSGHHHVRSLSYNEM